jgi:hypothetical protein
MVPLRAECIQELWFLGGSGKNNPYRLLSVCGLSNGSNVTVR